MWYSRSVLLANRIAKTQRRLAIPRICEKCNFTTICPLLSLTNNSSVAPKPLEIKIDRHKKIISGNSDRLSEGPGLEYFIANSSNTKNGVKERLRKRKTSNEDHPYLTDEMLRGDGLSGNFFTNETIESVCSRKNNGTTYIHAK